MTAITSTDHAVANGLLRVAPTGAPFPGRAGGAPMHYLIDARGAGTNRPLRRAITGRLLEVCPRDPDLVVAGLVSSGVPWGVRIAEASDRDYVTVLKQPRASGLRRQVEGEVRDRRVVLIDNWAASGGELTRSANVVRDHGGAVVCAVVISMRATPALEFPVIPAFDLADILESARRQELITDEQFARFTSSKNE